MLPQCQGPIWAIDDLSRCFQRNVLQVILPLTACSVSVLLVLIRLAHRYLVSRKGAAYKVLPEQ
ncbi:hypothetical protein N7522_013637 [Penicillium canescens]|nr:hypothetical protein N7522_013637 [Penicillium canescens]